MRAREARGKRAPGARRRAAGFTLVEVLVAFTILVVIVAAVYEALAAGMRATDMGAAATRAVLLARARLDELEATGDLTTGETSGEEPGAFADDPAYRWRTVITPYEGEEGAAAFDLPVPLLEARVAVTWESYGAERRVSLHTLLLGTGP